MWALIKPKLRHIVALVIFIFMLLGALYVVTKNTDAYEEAEIFVSNDTQIISISGSIKNVEFNFLDGFSFSGSEASFSFVVTGETATLIVRMNLRRTSGVWRIESKDIVKRELKN